MKKLLHPIDDVANALSVCRSSIYNLEKQGLLQFVKIGARTAVTDESVQAFLERQKTRAV